MRRTIVMVLGMLMTAFLVVPSYASSSTPSYPSGSAFNFFTGSSPSSSSSQSTSNYYTAVTSGLTNGFNMISKGFYSVQTNQASMSTAFTQLKAALVSGNSFSYIASVGDGNSTSSASSVLNAINSNLYYGFRSTISQLVSVDKAIDTMDGHLTSGFTALSKTLDNDSASELKALHGNNTVDQYYVLDAPVTGGFPMIHAWFSRFYEAFYDPVDDALKDASEDQRNELLDNFFGDDSKGVQSGQIGSLGDISSSAGDLLDTGGNIGNVFEAIGDSGSSVWSWFTVDNASAINGPGYVPPAPTLPPPPRPSIEPTPEPTSTPESTPSPEPTPEPTPSPEPTPEPTPSPEPTPEPTPSPEPTPEPTPSPEPTPEPTPSPEPVPQPIPDNVSYPFSAYVVTSPSAPYYSSASKWIEQGYLVFGTSLQIVSKSGSRYKDSAGRWWNSSDLAYGSLPASASKIVRSKRPFASSGSDIVDFYGPQMDELHRLIGW